MTIKTRDKRVGDMITSQFFIGEDADHLQLAGELRLHIGEWQLMGAALLIGAELTQGQLQILPSDESVVNVPGDDSLIRGD